LVKFYIPGRWEGRGASSRSHLLPTPPNPAGKIGRFGFVFFQRYVLRTGRWCRRVLSVGATFLILPRCICNGLKMLR